MEKEKKNQFLANIFLFLLIINPLLYFIRLINIPYLDTFVSSLFFIALIFLKKDYFFKKINLDVIILFLFFSLYMIVSGFFYQNKVVNWLGMIYIFFFSTFPWYIIGRNTSDYKMVLDKLVKNIYLILFAPTIVYFYKYFNGFVRIDDLALSYAFLWPAIIALYAFFVKKKVLYTIIFIYSSIMILVSGSRGPLLCLFVYFIIVLIISFKKRLFLNSLIFLLISYVILFFDRLLTLSLEWFAQHNITSRSLIKLSEGTITSGNGREDIRKVVLDLINLHPYTGIGVGVERFEIYKTIYVPKGMTDKLSTSYPHNFFLEIFVQYGIIIGLIIGTIVIILMGYAFFQGDFFEKNFIAILFSIAFMELMLSSTYLQSQEFFYFIGICITIINNKKKLVDKTCKL